MKKLVLLSLLAGLFIGQLFAATNTSGVDENGRLWNTAYFDIQSDIQSPVLGAIKYSNRVGFDWDKLLKSLKKLSANEITYLISGRIVVPESIKTDMVYITFGENKKFWVATCCDGIRLENCDYMKSNGARSVYKLSTIVNKEEMSSSDEIRTKVKTDNFGTNYVDFEIKMYINITQDKSYRSDAKANAITVIKKNYSKVLNDIRIKIAPKSRSYADKWQNAKIYVMDE